MLYEEVLWVHLLVSQWLSWVF